ncbi:MAG: MotA/TolQ/ExbB proton channel family protein [Pseudomonadota bacterium]
MDIATVGGIVGAFALIAIAMVLGGSPLAFVDVPSICIVLGGTFAVTMACFSLPEMLGAGKVIMKAMFKPGQNPTDAANRILEFADMARKQGLLNLQSSLDELESEPFLHKGLTMVIDGTPGEEVEKIMRQDIQATASRHSQSTSILRKAAEVSPAMGLIGTLVGLVQMLGNLDDPSSIGPSMAVALLTTFYGAILANVVFSPLASKLERNSTEELLTRSVYLLGTTSICRQENPRRLETQINTVLPPAKRVQFFD